MDKKVRTARERQEDDALNRALLWVAAAVVLEGLLMLIDRFYVNFYTDEIAIAQAISAVVRVGTVLFLAVAVLGLVWYRKARNGGKLNLLPAAVFLGGLILFAFCAILWMFYESGVTLLFVLVPAMAVLALVYYLYQRECFMAVALTALGLFGMWVSRKGSAGPYAVLIKAYLILMAVVSVALLVLLVRLRGRKGMMSLRGKEVRLLHKKANYPLLLATCVIVLAAFVAAVVLGATLSYYLIFALIAWAFILVVYYTVQLL